MQNIDVKNALLLLKERAIAQKVISYQEFAQLLGITKAPIINTVTSFLEQLTVEDIKSGRPILASIVVQKGVNAIPRRGFFLQLREQNLFHGEIEDVSAKTWHDQELVKLKEYYINKGS